MSTKKRKGSTAKPKPTAANKNYLLCQWWLNRELKLVIERRGVGSEREGVLDTFAVKPVLGWLGKLKGVAEQGLLIFTLADDEQILLSVSQLKSGDDTHDKVKALLVKYPDKNALDTKKKIHGTFFLSCFLFSFFSF